MDYKVLLNKNSHEEYIYIILDNSNITSKECRKLICEINEECRQHGYERIMIDLSKLTVTV